MLMLFHVPSWIASFRVVKELVRGSVSGHCCAGMAAC